MAKIKSPEIFRYIGPLAKRMALYIVLASTVITLFTSSIQLYQIYKTDVRGINLRLNEIRDSYSGNIASRVWVSNQQELELSLRGILRLPDIEHIEVYEDNELIAKLGTITNSDKIIVDFPLNYTFRKKIITIGRIHLTASLTRTYQHIIDQALVIFISNAVKTFIISGFMLFLFYHLVARHLLTLGQFSKTLNIDALDNKLLLKRTIKPGKIDELDYLGQSLIALQSRLKESIVELNDSQAQVTLLLNSTAEAIYGIDTNGCCTFANKTCLNLLAYGSDDELLGKNMHRLIHYQYPDGTHYPMENSHIFQAFQYRKGTHIDDEVLWRKDGSFFAAEYWSHPIFKQQQCVGAVVTFLDISKRIESERIIKENEKNLTITLNSIGDAVITADSEGFVTRMNPVAESLTGWQLKEAQGQSLKKVFSIINTTTREPIQNPIDKVIKTAATVHLSDHTTLISKTGIEYQITNSAAPIRDGDDIMGLVLVFNDITEQYHLREVAKKSKRDLQAIMDHSPAVIYVKDANGYYIFVNRKYEKLFDLNAKNIIGKRDNDLFDGDFAEQFHRNDQVVLDNGEILEIEESFPKNKNIYRYASIKFPLLNDSGEIYAVCSISSDISIRRQQEEQLRSTQKMDALGKLTGGIAHDYNNILGIVLGYTEQIINHITEPDELIKFTNSIKRAVQRGSKLAKKLLAFSRLKQPELNVIDINRLLRDQKQMLEKSLTSRIKFSLNLEHNLWPVELDSGDLEDAIINMSINAAHSMSSGGRLTISTNNVTLTDTDIQRLNLTVGNYVLLTISDTGSGMDIETKEKIFDPFYTTKGENGTGLGLSQVYGFVKRSAGSIKVYSELGLGSRFVLYLPQSFKVIDNVKNKSIETETLEVSQQLGGNETLLVVDDEQEMIELAYKIFSAQGYHVLTANDGKQALAILKKKSVDLIISDVVMPNMDGYQLATQVHKHYPHIKLQMVSGFSDERAKTIIDKSLHENMLYKPYTSSVLLRRVRKLLN